MSTRKFMLWFGIAWLSFSILFFIPFVFGFAADPEALIAIIPMACIFIGLGGVFVWIGISHDIKKKKYLKNGISYYAKIVAFEENHNIMINGRPIVYVEVRYYDRSGKIESAMLSTGSGSRSGFNLGETVQIAVYNGKAILVSEKSQNIRLQGEENLIMSYNAGAQNIAQLRPENYYCPHCGANLMISRGQTVKCPYCDSFVTNTRTYA